MATTARYRKPILKTRTISVRVRPDQYTGITRAARAAGLSISEYIVTKCTQPHGERS